MAEKAHIVDDDDEVRKKGLLVCSNSLWKMVYTVWLPFMWVLGCVVVY